MRGSRVAGARLVPPPPLAAAAPAARGCGFGAAGLAVCVPSAVNAMQLKRSGGDRPPSLGPTWPCANGGAAPQTGMHQELGAKSRSTLFPPLIVGVPP